MINYLKRIFSNLVLTILYKPRKWTVICCLMFGLVLEKVAPWPPTLSLSSHQQDPCIILGVQWGSCFSYSDAGQETVLPVYVFLFGFSYSIASSSDFGKKTASCHNLKGHLWRLSHEYQSWFWVEESHLIASGTCTVSDERRIPTSQFTN